MKPLILTVGSTVVTWIYNQSSEELQLIMVLSAGYMILLAFYLLAN